LFFGVDDCATVEQLEELEKKIVKEAQQAAFAKDIAELVDFVKERVKTYLMAPTSTL
jgi:hypothetical protein